MATPWEFGTRRKSKQRQVDYELEVTCQKSLDNTNITSPKDFSNQLKTIFPIASTTALPQTLRTKPDLPNNKTVHLNVYKTILPKCGGVRRSAALDNIFGKSSLTGLKYNKTRFNNYEV